MNHSFFHLEGLIQVFLVLKLNVSEAFRAMVFSSRNTYIQELFAGEKLLNIFDCSFEG